MTRAPSTNSAYRQAALAIQKRRSQERLAFLRRLAARLRLSSSRAPDLTDPTRPVAEAFSFTPEPSHQVSPSDDNTS